MVGRLTRVTQFVGFVVLAGRFWHPYYGGYYAKIATDPRLSDPALVNVIDKPGVSDATHLARSGGVVPGRWRGGRGGSCVCVAQHCSVVWAGRFAVACATWALPVSGFGGSGIDRAVKGSEL